MSVDEEYDPMTEHSTQFAFKDKIAYIQDQHAKYYIPKSTH